MSIVDTNSAQAVLEGGPVTIPNASRVLHVSPVQEKIKLPHYGGYEHFERVGSPLADGGRAEIIYRWTMRTEIAE